jgi:hypothetical protein
MITDPKLLRLLGNTFGLLSTSLATISALLWVAEVAAHWEAGRQESYRQLDEAETEVTSHAR